MGLFEMNRFRVQIASNLDRRENLVVEIWYGSELIAEINDEKNRLEIEIYPNETEKLVFDCEEFLDVLGKAKNKLLDLRADQT